MGMKALECAVCRIQMQVAELVNVELIVRRGLLVERRRRDEGGGASSSDPFGYDAFSKMGSGHTRGLLTVCPDLEKDVAERLCKEAAAAKERRKRNVERTAAEAPPHKK